jgi:hypothetical protein
VLEHHEGEELCQHSHVAVNEGVLNILDIEQGFSDAHFRLKLLLLLLGESEEEEMSSTIFLALTIYRNFQIFQSKMHRNRKLNL